MSERRSALKRLFAPSSGRRSPLRWGPAAARRGVTLIELLLVLALLVIVATMAYPAFFGPMKNQELRRSADRIRSAWGKAQVQAMKTGRIHMFRIQKDTNKFEIRPFEDDQAATESDDAVAQISTQPNTTIIEDTLPEDIKLSQVTSVGDMRTALTQQEVASDVGLTSEGLNEAWSSPILFYPDGTSSNSRLLLTNDTYYVILQLRGLTGVAQVSDLLLPSEVPTK